MPDFSSDIVVYGAFWCPDCRRSKQFLGEHQIPYNWVNIEEDADAERRVIEINDGKRIIPTIVFADGSILVEPSNAELAAKLELKTTASRLHYPVIVIGGGPAGLTAALYLAREGIDTLIIERAAFGGQAAATEKLDNLPGFPDGVDGGDFSQRLRAQAERFGVELLQAQDVTRIHSHDNYHCVDTAAGDEYSAQVVLITSGSRYRRLNVTGESDYIGAGVHFCATCDGPFYKGKEVAVVGGGNSAAEESLLLTKFAERVTVLVRGSALNASQVIQESVLTNPKIEVKWNTEVQEFLGAKAHLNGLRLRNNRTEAASHMAVDGAFVFIGLDPNTGFLEGAGVRLDNWGFIETGHRLVHSADERPPLFAQRDPAALETSVPGIFAAGDVRAESTKQVAAAAGEGATAARKRNSLGVSMSTPIKLAVIGAGSAQFSLGLVKDICLTESLNGSLITFMDIDPDRLDMIHKLGARYANELGADLRFESTTDRQEALQDVDFVINTASGSSHQKQRDGRELLEKYGYYHGGRMRQSGFVNLDLMLGVTSDMEDICPDAWLIQSGNPVYEGCTLMTRESSIKVCGLCHGHYGVYEIARTLGLTDLADITWQAPGLNHNIWLTHFYYKGEDAYPLLEQWIAEEGENYWQTHVAERTHDIQMSRGTIHMYRMYGLMPIGDTPRRGGWWYHSDIDTKMWWFPQPWGGPDTHLARPFFVDNLEKRVAQMTELTNDPTTSLIKAFGAEKTKEQQVPIIDGLVNDNEGQFQVNVPNYGALAGVPDDVVVEVPAIVNRSGIHPLRVDPLPEKILYTQILPEVLEMERELLAFHTGDRALLLLNALDCEQTHSYNQALTVLEELMEMDGNERLNEHYEWEPGQEMLTEPVRTAVLSR